MPVTAVVANGAVVFASSEELSLVTAPDTMAPLPGWTYDGEQFVAPPAVLPWYTQMLDGKYLVDSVPISQEGMPPGINVTINDLRMPTNVQTGADAEWVSVAVGDAVVRPRPDCDASTLDALGLTERSQVLVVEAKRLTAPS